MIPEDRTTVKAQGRLPIVRSRVADEWLEERLAEHDLKAFAEGRALCG